MIEKVGATNRKRKRKRKRKREERDKNETERERKIYKEIERGNKERPRYARGRERKKLGDGIRI